MTRPNTPQNDGSQIGPDEVEFAQAIHALKARTGRAFPTWSQVLAILTSLGYEKRERVAAHTDQG